MYKLMSRGSEYLLAVRCCKQLTCAQALLHMCRQKVEAHLLYSCNDLIQHFEAKHKKQGCGAILCVLFGDLQQPQQYVISSMMLPLLQV